MKKSNTYEKCKKDIYNEEIISSDILCPDCQKFYLIMNYKSNTLYCPAHWCQLKNKSVYNHE